MFTSTSTNKSTIIYKVTEKDIIIVEYSNDKQLQIESLKHAKKVQNTIKK